MSDEKQIPVEETEEVKTEETPVQAEPTAEELAEAQKRGEAMLAEKRARQEKRLNVLKEFQQKVEMAKKQAMSEGYLVDFFVGFAEPYGEVAVKMKVTEMTPEEIEQMNQIQMQADAAAKPAIQI